MINCLCNGFVGLIDTQGGAFYTSEGDAVECSPIVKKIIALSVGLLVGASFFALGGITLSGYYEYGDRVLLGIGVVLCLAGVGVTYKLTELVLLKQVERLERLYRSVVLDYSTDNSSSSQATV